MVQIQWVEILRVSSALLWTLVLCTLFVVDGWFVWCKQWVEILETVQRVIHWCDIDSVDAIMSSDVSLRLGAVYESAALLRSSNSTTGKA